jgi:hypothetical protein
MCILSSEVTSALCSQSGGAKAIDVSRRDEAAAVVTWIFEHVLRSSESYTEKWNYVLDNPVRAGLADAPAIGHIRTKSW